MQTLTEQEKAVNYLIPKPSPVRLIRIGGAGDGAYLVPDDLEGIDACFSPGVNNFKNFEDELATNYGIKSHMCDFSSDSEEFNTPLIDGMQTFEKKWLDVNDTQDSIRLQEWVEKYSPDASKDLILQMDIEGAEYRNLLAAQESTLRRFRIVVIELHGLNALLSQDFLSTELAQLLNKMDATHTCVHAHPNNCCGDFIDEKTGCNIPNVIELTYLRRDRFKNNREQSIKPQIPHPYDIPCNVRDKFPIHLNENWLKDKTRSLESQNKVLEDRLYFEDWDKIQSLLLLSEKFNQDRKAYQSATHNLYLKIQSCLNTINFELDSRFDFGINLAIGKKFKLSQAFGSFPMEGIIHEQSPFFFHTAIGENQSITIDLEQSLPLKYLVIKNRLDMCQERAHTLLWSVHDEPKHSPRHAYPVDITEDFLSSLCGESITPLLGEKGRYLTIISPASTALHFSSIKIY